MKALFIVFVMLLQETEEENPLHKAIGAIFKKILTSPGVLIGGLFVGCFAVMYHYREQISAFISDGIDRWRN